MKQILTSLLLVAGFTLLSKAQFSNYTVALEPMQINGLPGLQSYAWGKHNGKWILIGGRLDGLHRRQPFAAFAAAGNNTNIYIVDPVTKNLWSASLSSLPVSVAEQLQSTNMQFYQKDNMLYIAGGYGYSATAANHITHPYLTAIDLAGLSSAIINGQAITAHVRQISNQQMAVTGGHMGMLDSMFYLVCGNRFDGRYNPMGNPTFTQAYTNQIRKFSIIDNGTSLAITNFSAVTDSVNLHRRDYNMTSGFTVNGKPEYTIWTGVFQYGQNLPWLNTVNLQSTGHSVNNGFNQYLSQYHSANLPLFDSSANSMYTLFFGGISQYYADDSGNVVRNDSVPFVKTISYVKRDASGNLSEHRLQQQMPGYLGAGAELILADNVAHYDNEVVKMNSLQSDSVLAGYIVGGINSTSKNIFWINDGTQSSANPSVYKVWLVKSKNTSVIHIQDPIKWKVSVYPNPSDSQFNLRLQNFHPQDWIQVKLTDVQGRLISKVYDGKAIVDVIEVSTKHLSKGVYFLTIQSGQVWHVERVVVK